jgi:hypothetical protein
MSVNFIDTISEFHLYHYIVVFSNIMQFSIEKYVMNDENMIIGCSKPDFHESIRIMKIKSTITFLLKIETSPH